MINWLLDFFVQKSDTSVLQDSVSAESISRAYDKTKKEIESLRLYDRGEKQIDAPDLTDIV